MYLAVTHIYLIDFTVLRVSKEPCPYDSHYNRLT